MKETEEFLNSILKDNTKIVLGLSGGPDSMCLFHVLNSLKDKYNLEIICAHVNHNTRKENQKERDFVKEYCLKNKAIFEEMTISEYKNNKFTESEAREKRYAFFDQVMQKYKASYLMTAHHGDDLIETILMRMVRGSNLKGYIGIPKINKYHNYYVVRPLLLVNKKRIIEYLKENKIAYVMDNSNENEKYTRNRFRKHVLPELEKEDKNVYLKFLKYSEELEKTSNYLNKIIDKKIAKIYKNGKIYIDALMKEDDFIVDKILERVIENIQKEEIFNINDKSFQEIKKLLTKNSNKKISLSDNFIARRSYNYLIIEKNKNIEDYEYVLNDEVNILNKYNIKIVKKSNDTSNNVIRLNSKEISLPLKIRNVKDGDKIKVKNLQGSKKIKDIFIDVKLDQVKRKEYPLVLDSKDNVIWLPGLKKSIFDKEISEKYDIILKYTEE